MIFGQAPGRTGGQTFVAADTFLIIDIDLPVFHADRSGRARS